MKDMVFLHGKEAFWVNLLLLFAVIVFMAPIILVFLLRFIYKAITTVNEQVKEKVTVQGVLESV
jgi:uncharacterized membrane protein